MGAEDSEMTETKIPGIKAKHAIVTDECRANMSPEAAFDEALERLRQSAEGTNEVRIRNGQHRNVNYHFVLVVEDA